MTCTYTGGEELAEIIITVNKDPDSKKAEKDMSDFERIHSSEKPYPYKLANDRALVADTDTHIGELSCHPNQQNRWQCSIAPMFFVVVNKVSYRKLRPRKSDDKGHILLVETAGDRRNESVKPVANGQKTPPEKLYIPFTTEITAIQLQLINAKDNKELTPLCIPEGKTLDRLPMTLGTSAVIEIQGVVDKEGIVQEGTKCTMRCGNDSRTSSCWQKKTPYQYTCEWYKSAANYVAESMLWLTPPIGCWEVKDEVPKSPKEPAPADKPSDVEVVNDLDDWYADEADEADEYDPEDIRLTPEQERLKKSHFKKMVMLSAETDPFKLLGLNQTAHDVFLSAGELKRIRQKHGITEPQCSDGLFRPLCKIINHKLEEARRVLNEAKRAKDTKLDGDGDVKEEFKKICSSDANGDQYCEYVKKSELKMHNLNEL
ncbi:hypothetical protein [Endozoicomonas montiporae]|nr:hypothetical protein [Endozoicomonas montiporae]